MSFRSIFSLLSIGNNILMIILKNEPESYENMNASCALPPNGRFGFKSDSRRSLSLSLRLHRSRLGYQFIFD